jgi:phosphopantetheine adenylyltransferase
MYVIHMFLRTRKKVMSFFQEVALEKINPSLMCELKTVFLHVSHFHVVVGHNSE